MGVRWGIVVMDVIFLRLKHIDPLGLPFPTSMFKTALNNNIIPHIWKLVNIVIIQWLGRKKSQWANGPMLTQINGPFQISMGHGIKCMGHQWVSISNLSQNLCAQFLHKTSTLIYAVYLPLVPSYDMPG